MGATNQNNVEAATSSGEDTIHKKLVPPDGGWGWMVVFGSAYVLVFNQSLISTFSLIYGAQIEKFGAGIEGAALVANLMFLVLNFSGPFSGHLIKTISYRKVCILGSLLSGLGVMISSFATSLLHMILGYSVLTGIGMGMIQSSTFVSVNSYFKEKRGRAIGISLSGAGFGQVIMPHIVKYLHETYSYQGGTLVIGALCLNGVVGALLLQPVSKHMKVENEIVQEKKHLLEKPLFNENVTDKTHIENETKNVYAKAEHVNEVEGKLSNVKINPSNENHTSETEKKDRKMSKLMALVSYFDLNLLKSIPFMTTAFACALGHSSMINFGMLFPFFLLEQVNLNMRDTAFAMSVLSGADIFGRILVPMFTDKFKVKATSGMMIGCAFLGITRQILAYQMDYTIILILSALIGVGKTFIVVNQNIAVSDQCNRDQVPSAIGLFMVTKGTIVLPVGMLIGWVKDYTESFILSVSVINVMATIVVLLLLPHFLYDKCCTRKSQSKTLK